MTPSLSLPSVFLRATYHPNPVEGLSIVWKDRTAVEPLSCPIFKVLAWNLEDWPYLSRLRCFDIKQWLRRRRWVVGWYGSDIRRLEEVTAQRNVGQRGIIRSHLQYYMPIKLWFAILNIIFLTFLIKAFQELMSLSTYMNVEHVVIWQASGCCSGD